MGICLNSEKNTQEKQMPKTKAPQSQIENVDVVKMKLKQARDRIRTFISKKNADIAQIDAQIKEKIPQYQRTKNKKPLVPLLKAKKELLNAVETGDVRLRLVNQKLAEVEVSQLNKQTIQVLEQSNKYINEVQAQLEEKDWRGVLADAQNKYELEWPDDRQEVQEDPAFQQMWNELGGNKLPKTIQKKTVNVDVIVQEKQKEKLALA